MNEQADTDWIEFDRIAGEAKTLIGRLGDSFEAQQARARFGELCYWFSEARIAQQNERVEPVQEVEYCDICPHALWAHNPDGSCGCGMDCANERKAEAENQAAIERQIRSMPPYTDGPEEDNPLSMG